MKPKICGPLKEKLDAAMGKAMDYARTFSGTPPGIKWEDLNRNEKWTLLHWAMTRPECADQNAQSMGKLMDEIYAVANDDHLATYLKNYKKNS